MFVVTPVVVVVVGRFAVVATIGPQRAAAEEAQRVCEAREDALQLIKHDSILRLHTHNFVHPKTRLPTRLFRIEIKRQML